MQRLAAILSAVLGLGLLLTAILGPLGTGTITFNMNSNAIAQYKGGEVVTIAAGLFLLACAWMWWNRSRIAPALTLGVAIYAVYTMVTVVMGQEFALFPDGNVERYFLMYMGLTGLGTMLIIFSINFLIQEDIPVSSRLRSATQWVLGIHASFFTFAWVSAILTSYSNGFTQLEEESRLLYWLIKYLDLGFMIPIAIAGIILLRNRQAIGSSVVLALSGFLVWMMMAIAAMSVGLTIHDETGGSLPLAAMMVVLSLASLVVFVNWVRPIQKST